MRQENTYLATLSKRSQLFDGIGIDNLSALFSCLGARRVRLAKGEHLFRTGEKADRLMAYLRAISKETGSREFDIQLDRQGLADYLCVERSALSAEISRLSRAGVIFAHRHHFILQNLKGTKQ